MIEEKQGYYLVTAEGKKEFTLQSTASISNSIMIFMGIAIVVFTFSLELKIVPIISVAFFGIVLIVIGFSFLLLNKSNKPQLPPEAKVMLKELNRH
jgi:ABC-type bacteriocin/lantibiotic exporter with double-glycine peptidase domain